MSNKAANTSAPKKKKSGKKKRLVLHVGDIVSFQSMLHHMTGAVGEVVAIVDRDHVVIRGMGAQYADYDGLMWVALTYKPTGLSTDGENISDMRLWVRKIRYSVHQLPPKVVKPKPETSVALIEGTEQLLQVLASDEKHKAVHFVPDAAKTSA